MLVSAQKLFDLTCCARPGDVIIQGSFFFTERVGQGAERRTIGYPGDMAGLVSHTAYRKDLVPVTIRTRQVAVLPHCAGIAHWVITALSRNTQRQRKPDRQQPNAGNSHSITAAWQRSRILPGPGLRRPPDRSVPNHRTPAAVRQTQEDRPG